MNTSLRVLVIEDRENDALLMLRELRRAGYEPTAKLVATQETLLSALKQDVWDVVLADYSLPQFSGLAALRTVREQVPDAPFIIVSGAIGEETAVAAMKSGADDYILKQNLARLGPVIDRELRDAEVRQAQKQAEKDLKEREALFRSIIENVSDVIVILDGEGIIRYHSPSVERILGFTSNELIGTSGLDYLHHDEQSVARDALAQQLRPLQEFPLIECRVRNKDEDWRTLEGTVTNLLDDPAVKGIVCNFRDVTERKQLHDQLIRAQRMESIGNLAGGIAHNLNNLLTPILVSTDMLKEGLSEADREFVLQGLASGVQRVTEIVHQLLSFARGMEAERRAAHASELISETQRLLQLGFPKSIKVSISQPDYLWPTSIDATKLAQVLMNLCINARDAMPDGGQLNISTANVIVGKHDPHVPPHIVPGRYVLINVIDTGTGIPPELQKQIFDSFFTTKEREGGTGLGLSSTLSIMQNCSGFINVDSEVGQGTRFAVYLPAATIPETATAEAETHQLLIGRGEVVLIIEDEAAIREVVKETLEAHNYQTLTAGDETKGLALFREHSQDIDLVLVNLTLSVRDRQSTIHAIRALAPQTRIILQGGSESEHGEPFSNLGTAERVLEKPYSIDELLLCVHEVLQPR